MINVQWHRRHIMPKHPTREQQLMWHAQHLQNCRCRRPTPKLFEELKKRGLLPCEP